MGSSVIKISIDFWESARCILCRPHAGSQGTTQPTARSFSAWSTYCPSQPLEQRGSVSPTSGLLCLVCVSSLLCSFIHAFSPVRSQALY